MSLDTYLSFIMAGIILCLVPGPDMIYLLSRSVAQGRKAGLYAAVGINVGAYIHLVAAVIGLTTILATSILAFNIVKYLGAIYLVYLGFSIIFAESKVFTIETMNSNQLHSNRAIFWQGFLSDVLNPKVAIFYVAILPQFVNTSSSHVTAQFIILGVSLNIIGIITNILYVYFSSNLTKALRKNRSISTWLNRVLGTIFIALGLKLANEKLL